jgi:hypothetical protein
MTHGKDTNSDAHLLKQQYLIGDKGFGNTGVPFEDHAQNGLEVIHRLPVQKI